MPAPPSPAELGGLARKYAKLSALRRDRASGSAVADRAVLRSLAREFPGALRELDTVTEDEIATREAALSNAAEGGPVEAWMAWMVAYHVTMRAALSIKARLSRVTELTDEGAQALALWARQHIDATPVSIDERFVHEVAAPPDGRLNRMVFERLGEAFGVPHDVIWATLFPARRKGRY